MTAITADQPADLDVFVAVTGRHSRPTLPSSDCENESSLEPRSISTPLLLKCIDQAGLGVVLWNEQIPGTTPLSIVLERHVRD